MSCDDVGEWGSSVGPVAVTAGGTATEIGFFLGGAKVRMAATDLTITMTSAASP